MLYQSPDYLHHTSNAVKRVVIAVLFVFTLSFFANGATYVVTSAADTYDANCDGHCTLREAIAAANSSPTNDEVVFHTAIFSTPRTIGLGDSGLGLFNNGEITITGPGAGLLTVNGTNLYQVFIIGPGTRATVSGLKITNGSATATHGSGIHSSGDLTLRDLIITGNSRGGIYNGGGTLNVERVSITNNTAANGGGIYNDSGNLNVSDSTIANNGVFSGGLGGGISNSNGTVALNNTNLSSNTAPSGAGIHNSQGTVSVTNTTISNNISNGGSGGGVYNGTGTIYLDSVTVADNQTTGQGGGITNQLGGTFNTRNSIFANNSSNGTGPDFAGVLVSNGHNLVESVTDTTIAGSTTGNILGQDPILGPLQFNGGLTETRALLGGSPAIDTGDAGSSLTADQRRIPRPLDGDGNGSSVPDIGAFEAGSLMVTKVADTNDGNCDADCSLREAISAANASSANDAITFSGLFNTPQTITLTGTQLALNNSGTLVISGPGRNLLAISGNNSTRVFFILPGTNVTLSGIGISNGRATFTGGGGASGGGLQNRGNLSIVDSTISGNSTEDVGGGIYNDTGATLTIAGTTISTNTVTNRGGGIFNFRDGVVTITDSVIRNNTAFAGGGVYSFDGPVDLNRVTVIENTAINGAGIFNDGLMNIESSTIAGNAATISTSGGNGGGIYNFEVLNVSRSSITGNTAQFDGGGIYTPSASATITNTTIATNTARNRGGGLYHENVGTITFVASTIAKNVADSDRNGTGGGGGVWAGFPGPIRARSSIIADNEDYSGVSPDFSGTLLSDGYNLLEDLNGISITGTTTGNILGQDPHLIALANYGGVTQTIGLMPNSPAVDAGDGVGQPPTDQRGIARPQDGDLDGTARPDIGAYERRVATLNVTKAEDTNDGVCDSDCSLREAITATHRAAQPDYAIQFDAAVFMTPRTIILSQSHLSVNNKGTLLISGTGRNLLTISGNDQLRVFFNQQGSALTLRNLTIVDGKSVFGNQGSAVYNGGATLTLYDVAVRNNVTTSESGGVYNSGGVLRVIDSLFEGNSAGSGGGSITTGDSGQLRSVLAITNSVFRNNQTDRAGGAIEIWSGSATIDGSIFESNAVVGSDSGGAIRVRGGQTQIRGTIFTGNRAGSGGAIRIDGTQTRVSIVESSIRNNSADYGGGIFFGSGTLNLINSTVASNSATGRGGGLITNGGTATIVGSTFTDNAADDDAGGIGNWGTMSLTNSTVSGNRATDSAGGLRNDGIGTVVHTTISNNTARFGGGGHNGGLLNLRSSIVADNTASTADPDFSGPIVSEGYNLIETMSPGLTLNGLTTGNILGSDPNLGPLFNHGGLTMTHSLLSGSLAIDAADPSLSTTIDQRGFARPRDGDGNGNSRSDIGSYERRSTIVTNTSDNGVGSLRNALAGAPGQADAIVFVQSLFSSAQTISLTTGELVVPANASVAIDGRGEGLLTITGNNQSRVLFVTAGARVVVSGIAITGGNGTGSIHSGHGGGISNWGHLSLKDAVITGNRANGNGGGIGSHLNSTLIISNSTVDRNSTATIAGGGIYVQNSSAVISGSTINENSAAGDGGGLFNSQGPMTVVNSTISRNTSGGGGGGFSNFGAGSTLTLDHTTVSGNIAFNSNGGGVGNFGNGIFYSRGSIIANNRATDYGTSHDIHGTLNSQGYNLIENLTGTTIVGTATGNIIGVDPLIDPILRFNGGPTRTHALRPLSPAIDASNSINPTVVGDQRGSVRPVDLSNVQNIANAADIGALERQLTDVMTGNQFDYDGDGRADLSVRRLTENVWYLLRGSAGYTAQQFGEAGDMMAPADYDGDGKTDVAVFRPSAGIWFVFASHSQTFQQFGWGADGDLPVPTDRDADGKADLVVYRESNNTWYVRYANGTFATTEFGVAGDKPLVGDFDADGIGDIALFRPSNNNWYILKSSLGFFIQTWGEAGDIPVPADFDGDGATDQGVFRPSTGQWFLSRTTDGFGSQNWGQAGDIPVAADYDGDGKADVAVFRPTNGTWYIVNSSTGQLIQQFGQAGDVPTQSAFLY